MKDINILVVDDDTANRMLVIDCLTEQRKNYNFFSAPNGQVALSLCNKVVFDLILLDWEMPVMNGIETLKELKKDDVHRKIPVIMYTGVMTDSVNLQEALEHGAIEFLRKPIDNIELLARVEATLKLIQVEQEKLELKNKELVSLTLQIAEMNTFLTEMKMDLETFRKKTNLTVGRLEHRISQKLQNEDYWEQIKIRISSIHEGFYNQLSIDYPSLTNGEVRLASLLKIGLTNGEIASIMNITTKSLEKASSKTLRNLRAKVNSTSKLET